jgi:hypothetical protein
MMQVVFRFIMPAAYHISHTDGFRLIRQAVLRLIMLAVFRFIRQAVFRLIKHRLIKQAVFRFIVLAVAVAFLTYVTLINASPVPHQRSSAS